MSTHNRTTSVRVFLQARMSSRRFPGKVLAPFRGQPMIRQVLTAITHALPSVPVVVMTSIEPSDAPLVAYVETLGGPVYRGPLDDVFARFREGVMHYPCDWILRLSADSPLLNDAMLQAVILHAANPEIDLVTTIFPRTFPKGHNAELIRANTFQAIDMAELTAEDREHVTPYYYRHADRFRILNVSSGDPLLAEQSYAVDTLEDLQRLERVPDTERFELSHSSLS